MPKEKGTGTHQRGLGGEALEGEDGGGGLGPKSCAPKKWPDKIFPIVNFVLSHDGHFVPPLECALRRCPRDIGEVHGHGAAPRPPAPGRGAWHTPATASLGLAQGPLTGSARAPICAHVPTRTPSRAHKRR